MDQPTSWPCVEATTRRAPAARAAFAISASGAAAPNQTVWMLCSRISCCIFRAVGGVGSITLRGQRTTW